MEDLEVIVQRMLDAGESEENIASVIRYYTSNPDYEPTQETVVEEVEIEEEPVEETEVPLVKKLLSHVSMDKSFTENLKGIGNFFEQEAEEIAFSGKMQNEVTDDYLKQLEEYNQEEIVDLLGKIDTRNKKIDGKDIDKYITQPGTKTKVVQTRSGAREEEYSADVVNKDIAAILYPDKKGIVYKDDLTPDELKKLNNFSSTLGNYSDDYQKNLDYKDEITLGLKDLYDKRQEIKEEKIVEEGEGIALLGRTDKDKSKLVSENPELYELYKRVQKGETPDISPEDYQKYVRFVNEFEQYEEQSLMDVAKIEEDKNKLLEINNNKKLWLEPTSGEVDLLVGFRDLWGEGEDGYNNFVDDLAEFNHKYQSGDEYIKSFVNKVSDEEAFANKNNALAYMYTKGAFKDVNSGQIYNPFNEKGMDSAIPEALDIVKSPTEDVYNINSNSEEFKVLQQQYKLTEDETVELIEQANVINNKNKKVKLINQTKDFYRTSIIPEYKGDLEDLTIDDVAKTLENVFVEGTEIGGVRGTTPAQTVEGLRRTLNPWGFQVYSGNDKDFADQMVSNMGSVSQSVISEFSDSDNIFITTRDGKVFGPIDWTTNNYSTAFGMIADAFGGGVDYSAQANVDEALRTFVKENARDFDSSTIEEIKPDDSMFAVGMKTNTLSLEAGSDKTEQLNNTIDNTYNEINKLSREKTIDIINSAGDIDVSALADNYKISQEEAQVVKNEIASNIEAFNSKLDTEELKDLNVTDLSQQLQDLVQNPLMNFVINKVKEKAEAGEYTQEELDAANENGDKLFAEIFKNVDNKIDVLQTEIKEGLKEASIQETLFRTAAKDYDNAVDARYKMDAELGTWYGSLYNAALEGTEAMFAGALSTGLDVATLLSAGFVATEAATGQVYNEETGEFEDKELTYSGFAEEWDGLSKSAKEQTLPFVRTFTDRYKMGTTDEWSQEWEQTFFGGALRGLVKSLPAMGVSTITGGTSLISTGAIGRFAFGAQQVEYMDQEIMQLQEAGVLNKNMSELEKWAIKGPIAVVSGTLEQYGFRNLTKGSGSWLIGATGETLKELPKNSTKQMFINGVRNKLNTGLGRGTLRLVNGALSEFETGALQNAAEEGIKEIYESFKTGRQKQIFETSLDEGILPFIESTLRAGAQEAIGGAKLSLIGAVNTGVNYSKYGDDLNNAQFQFVESILATDQSRASFRNSLNIQVMDGKMKPEQIPAMMRKWDDAKVIAKNIPNDVKDVRERRKMFDLINEKKSIQQELKNKTSIFTGGKKKRLSEIEAEMLSIKEFAEQDGSFVNSVDNINNKLRGRKTKVKTQVANTMNVYQKLQEQGFANQMQEMGVAGDNRPTLSNSQIQKTLSETDQLISKLSKSKNSVDRKAAIELQEVRNFIANQATTNTISVNQDLDADTQASIIKQNYRVNGRSNQETYIVNNQVVSKREFNEMIKDPEFVQNLKDGNASYSVVNASNNTINQLQQVLPNETDSINAAATQIFEDGTIHVTQEGKSAAQNIAAARELAGKLGVGFKVLNEEDYIKITGDPNSEGAFANNTIYVNRAALGTNIAVGSHEVLHGIFINAFVKDGKVTKEGIDKIDQLKAILAEEGNFEVVEERINANYKYVDRNLATKEQADKVQSENEGSKVVKNENGTFDVEKNEDQYYDEYINVFSDAIVNGEIKYKKPLFKRIFNWFKGISGKVLQENDINNGQELYDYIRVFSQEFIDTTADVTVAEDTITDQDITGETPRLSKTDIKETLDAIVQTPEGDVKFQTQEEFKADPEASFNAYNAIQNTDLLDGTIANMISKDKSLGGLDSQAVTDLIEKVKENTSLRVLKSFDPAKNESLFGYLLGKNPIVAKALLDEKAAYAKKPKGKSIDVVTQEGAAFDIAAEGSTIEEQVDVSIAQKERPKSKLRREIKIGEDIGIPSSVISEVKRATTETFTEGKIPDIESKEFKKALVDAFKTKLKPAISKMMGGSKKYENFLRDNKDILMQELPISYLVQIERLVPEAERVFTKVVKRNLSTTEVIKYKDQDRVYTESEKSGPTLYERLSPSDKDFVGFFTPPAQVPSKKDPSKMVKSGLKGTRKDELARNIGVKLASDLTPTVARRTKSLKEQAQIAEKLQTDPQLRFSKTQKDDLAALSALRSIAAATKYMGIGGATVNSSNRKQMQSDVFNAIVDYGLDENTFLAGMLGSGGAVRAQADGIRKKDQALNKWLKDNNKKYKKGNYYYKLTDGSWVLGKPPAEGGKQWKPPIDKNGKIREDLVAEKYRLYFGKSDPAYQKALAAAKSNNKAEKLSAKRVRVPEDGITKKWMEENKDQSDLNMQILEDVVVQLSGAVNTGMPIEVAALIITQGYQATEGLIKIAAPFKYRSRVFEYAKVGKTSDKTGKKFREEHNTPASVIGATLIYAIKNNQVAEIFPSIRENYYQVQLSKADDTLLDQAELGATLPKDYSVLDDASVRTAFAGINLNNIINPLTGESVMDEAGLGVPKEYQNIPDVYYMQNQLLLETQDPTTEKKVSLKDAQGDLKAYLPIGKLQHEAGKVNTKNIDESGVVRLSKSIPNSEILREAGIMDKALNIARDPNAPVKKIRVFDFDDTLARTKSNVLYTMPDGKEGKLTAEEFAKRGTEMLEQGAEFDFSEFNKVMEGKKGPLFEVAKKIQDARGTEDVFVLTARAMEAAPAIKEFLDSIGLEIPLKNITGLGDSSPLAKSGWIVDKAADGYNDFYFADDHMANVNAVKKVLDVIDVKSKVQQAKIKFSKNVDKDFNKIIEQKTGVDWYKEYSAARAQTMGAGKGRFKFLIPPSAEDFTGLLYRFLGKGKVGDAQMAWFKEHLLNPYARGMNDLSTDRVTMMNDFNALKKELAKSGSIPKNLKKKAIDNFTYEDVARVMAWDQQGIEVADLSKRDIEEFRSFIEKDPGLQVFVDQLIAINKGDGYTYPGKNWLAGNITTDLVEGLNTNKRDKYLEQWRENVDLIFSEKNLNKIEALFGSRYREALEDSLRRMKSGKNRTSTGSRLENRLLDYVNNSVGTVMFLNMRSGVLQTISSINFLNWKDNNPLQAGKAFANQKQYWSDFMTLMNSDFLVDRRKGLKINVSESEIADAARDQKNKARAVVNYLLKKGFTVTQIMDSFAIASGGATFYRNRIKSLMKQGMTQKEAEAQAFQDFRETAEESQQSARPDKISQQQASGLGRVVLAFANTPMQYNRIIKKATLDLVNGRGDYKTNLSKIVYYGTIQNIIFTALQQAIFAMAFSDEEDEEEKKKYYKVGNSMLDNLLRGLGVGGQAVLTVKNLGMDVYDKYQKSVAPDASYYDKQPDYAESAWHLLDFSPPISIKARKLRQAAKNWEYNNWKHDKDPWSLDDPAWLSGAYVVSALTNIPLDRLVKKMDNVRGAMESDQEWWKRVAMLSGWAEWELESTADKETRKQNEKQEKRVFEGQQDPVNYSRDEQVDILKQYGLNDKAISKFKTKEERAEAIKKLQKSRNKTITPSPVMFSNEYKKLKDLTKDQQVDILKNELGLNSIFIRKQLTSEDKRVKTIIKLRKNKK